MYIGYVTVQQSPRIVTSTLSVICHQLAQYKLHAALRAVASKNNIYLLQLGCHPVAVVILHVKQNMKSVTNIFKSGGLHEKHVVATWNLGNHLSICL